MECERVVFLCYTKERSKPTEDERREIFEPDLGKPDWLVGYGGMREGG